MLASISVNYNCVQNKYYFDLFQMCTLFVIVDYIFIFILNYRFLTDQQNGMMHLHLHSRSIKNIPVFSIAWVYTYIFMLCVSTHMIGTKKNIGKLTMIAMSTTDQHIYVRIIDDDTRKCLCHHFNSKRQRVVSRLR